MLSWSAALRRIAGLVGLAIAVGLVAGLLTSCHGFAQGEGCRPADWIAQSEVALRAIVPDDATNVSYSVLAIDCDQPSYPGVSFTVADSRIPVSEVVAAQAIKSGWVADPGSCLQRFIAGRASGLSIEPGDIATGYAVSIDYVPKGEVPPNDSGYDCVRAPRS